MKKNKYFTVAETLFEMETQSIADNIDFHWDFNGWYDKYGKNSTKFEPQLAASQKDIHDLSLLIAKDFHTGFWNDMNTDSYYNPEMRDEYGGFMTERLEHKLATLTGVGTQAEIFAK